MAKNKGKSVIDQAVADQASQAQPAVIAPAPEGTSSTSAALIAEVRQEAAAQVKAEGVQATESAPTNVQGFGAGMTETAAQRLIRLKAAQAEMLKALAEVEQEAQADADQEAGQYAYAQVRQWVTDIDANLPGATWGGRLTELQTIVAQAGKMRGVVSAPAKRITATSGGTAGFTVQGESNAHATPAIVASEPAELSANQIRVLRALSRGHQSYDTLRADKGGVAQYSSLTTDCGPDGGLRYPQSLTGRGYASVVGRNTFAITPQGLSWLAQNVNRVNATPDAQAK